MLATALFAGEEAVRHTPEQLDVLARGRRRRRRRARPGRDHPRHGRRPRRRGGQLPEIPHYAAARIDDVHHVDSRFRFCTNFIVIGERLDRDAFIGDLERLGDSVLVVGDEATLKVHVHTDDPDSAKALFAAAGRVEHEDIADMHEQVAGQRARLGDGIAAVVAVTSGNGLRSLYEQLGALAVDGGPTLNPPTKDLLEGIDACPAAEVVLLPNSADVLMAAEEAARLAAKPVTVVNCESQQAGLAALVEFDPRQGAEANAERLQAALAGVRVGAVAPAARDDAEGRFRRGDAVGFAGDQLVAWGGAGSTLLETVAAARRGRRDRHRDRGRGGADPARRARARPLRRGRDRTAPRRDAELLLADRRAVAVGWR